MQSTLRYILLLTSILYLPQLRAHDVFLQADQSNPSKTLPVEAFSFVMDESQYPPRVRITINNLTISVHPQFIALGVLFPLGKDVSCILSLREECAANNSIKTSLNANAGVLTTTLTLTLSALAESLRNLPQVAGLTYVLSEKPWSLEIDSFDTNRDLFYVYGRKDGSLVINEEWTNRWKDTLNEQQRALLNDFNQLVGIRRLMQSFMLNRLEGTHDDLPLLIQALKLQKIVQPYYQDALLTFDQRREFQRWLDNLDPNRGSPCNDIMFIAWRHYLK